MFANPRMNVLFDTREPETRVSAFDHGKRVACMLLENIYGLKWYGSLGRGPDLIANLERVHIQSKRCPMRPATHLNPAVFTRN